jgi:hypothetical protein
MVVVALESRICCYSHSSAVFWSCQDFVLHQFCCCVLAP